MTCNGEAILRGKVSKRLNSRISTHEPRFSAHRVKQAQPAHDPVPRANKMDYVLTPVVLDNGSGMIKAGYAGEEIPKSFFPS
jgi:Actin